MKNDVTRVNLRIVDLVSNKLESIDFGDGTGPYPVEPSFRMIVELGEGSYRSIDIPAEAYGELIEISNGG